MDGTNTHGYIQEDHGYDELMSNAVWSGPGDQFLYPQAQPQQDLYARYAAQPQPAYEHYDMQQQSSYPTLPYSNSPYAAQYQSQPQQQHVRPAGLFGATSTTVDPSLQNSVPYQNHQVHPVQQSTFSVSPNATISPQYLQYAMASSNGPLNHGIQSSAYQQTPITATATANTYNQQAQNNSAIYFNNPLNGNIQRNIANPIQYPPLPADAAQVGQPKLMAGNINRAITASSISSPKRQLELDAPSNSPRIQQTKPTRQAQNTLRMTHPELCPVKSDSSPSRLEHAPFLYFKTDPIQIPLGLKNTIPKYHPRKSRSGRELVPDFDASRTLTPARASAKKEKAPKLIKAPSSQWRGTGQPVKPISGKVVSLREDANLGSSPKPPSTPTESSSSEEELSSEEESEYEEEMPVTHIHEVRGTDRPHDLPRGTRWDAIGIIWKDPGSSPNSDVVKAAIEEYGNFVSNIRTKLKANKDDTAAHPLEAARLGADRRVLLESLYQTIDAANTHGYPAIVENLGGHHRLVNGLTTTLIECIKTDDFTGQLPKAVFRLLAKFQTMTDELLKKLKFDSIQKRWSKKADTDINKDIATTLANTIEAKERAAKAKKEALKAEEQKKLLDKVEQAKLRPSDINKSPATNPAKRPHEADPTNGKPNKKFASDASGSLTARLTLPKRANLLGISTKPTPKLVVRKREVSPPAASRLGALLASIAKPPELPKAPETPARAPETPEEKTRRERKESRRHLRVKFKEGPELEQIRLFKHEQAEDEGRQDDMLRDAHDDRSEGMMHKRRVSEAIDEDDDNQAGDINDKPYRRLIKVDFTGLEKVSLFGASYVTRGGERTFITPEQQVQEKREGLELMVVYTDPSDIPPSAKEPHQQPIAQVDGTEDHILEARLKEPTEPWLIQRLHEIRQLGPDYASHLFAVRLEEQKSRDIRENRFHGVSYSLTAPPSTNAFAIVHQFGGSVSQPSESQFSQLPKFQAPLVDIQQYQNLLRIVESIKGKPFPATEPPEWMTNESQKAIWWKGYNSDNVTKENPEVDQIMSEAPIENAHYQPPQIAAPQMQPVIQQAMQYQPAPPPVNMSSIAPSADIAQQVQNLLADYTISNSNPSPAPAQQIDYHAWAARAAVQAQAQAQAYAAQNKPENQQSRWETSWGDQDNSTSKTKRGYELKEWNGAPKPADIFDENGEYKGKKRPCRFYREGKCTKGAKCTFLHD